MIARVFRELVWIEELGSGRKNIRKYAPLYFDDYRIVIENEEKFVFSITYRNTNTVSESEPVNLKSEPVNSILTTAQINLIYALIDENIIENINEPVKQSLFKIISYLLNHNGTNRNMLTFVLSKGRASLARHLKLLRNANIIEFIGSDKTGGYYLTKQAKERLQTGG